MLSSSGHSGSRWFTLDHCDSCWINDGPAWATLGSVDIRHPDQRVQREPRHTSGLVLQTVWTPTLCIPDTSDRPGYFLISLSNLATSLITYGAPCITLLCSTFIATLLHI